MPQTQTPTTFSKPGRLRDYTPAADVFAGDIVVIGLRCFLAATDIAALATAGIGLNGTPTIGGLHAEGVWLPPKDASVFADGDPVFWNATGDPTGGTAGTGCATSTPTGVLMGYSVGAALTGDARATVLVQPPARRVPVNTVAAAGTTQADAAQLYEGHNLVTGADDTKGVRLPAAAAGIVVTIKVGDGADLKVYPATGDAINAIAANGAMTVVDDVCFMLIARDGTTWDTLPLLPS